MVVVVVVVVVVVSYSQEALTKINVHKERDEKEQVVFNQSMKVLERLMAHEKKMNEFMSIKCNDRTEFKLEECERLERGQDTTTHTNTTRTMTTLLKG